MLREDWEPGATAWFEYHCWESAQSGDAPAWYRSHQQVVVLAHDPADHDCLRPKSLATRAEDGQPCVYQVRFADRLEWTVFEDELMTDPADFERPAPPKMP